MANQNESTSNQQQPKTDGTTEQPRTEQPRKDSQGDAQRSTNQQDSSKKYPLPADDKSGAGDEQTDRVEKRRA